MRTATGFVNTANARACLSLTTHVLYSFCCTEVVARTCTPPWQLGEAHEPGPVYLGASAVCATEIPDQTAKQMARRMFPITIPDAGPPYNDRGVQPI